MAQVHLGIDASTLEIRAIEVTDNSVGDAPMLPGLLGQIPPDEPIASVSTDGAYDTKACHAAIMERGAQAIIPRARTPRCGSPKRLGPWCVTKRCWRARGGWRIWKKWSGYHRRSLVETKMHCFKRLGERVMARTFERQVTESCMCGWPCSTDSRNLCPTTVAVPAVA